MSSPCPSHRPVFPSTFLEEAEKMIRQRHIPYQLWQRAALVTNTRSQICPGHRIACAFSCASASVFAAIATARAVFSPNSCPPSLLPGHGTRYGSPSASSPSAWR